MDHQISPVVYNNQRILTTTQVAQFLETETDIITRNFNRNKDHYTEGRHYFVLKGDELKKFASVNLTGTNLSMIRSVYLWTEKGVLMHVKSVNTDVAWRAHEDLVDTYFRVQENSNQPIHREDINEAFRRRRDANMWLLEKMRFTSDERTNAIAMLGHLRDLDFADNAFLDTSLGKGFYPWCEEQGYDMSLVKYTEKSRLVCWELNADKKSYNFDKPIRRKVHSYPIDPFGLAWEKFLVECYWPQKFLPYIKRKYKGEERAKNIEAGIKVIGFYTGLQIATQSERKAG